MILVILENYLPIQLDFVHGVIEKKLITKDFLQLNMLNTYIQNNLGDVQNIFEYIYTSMTIKK